MEKRHLEELSRLLDREMKLDGAEPGREAREQVFASEEVRGAYLSLQATLRALGVWEDEEAPAGLADRTVAYVRQHGQPVATFGEVLRDREQARAVSAGGSAGRWLLGNLRDAIAVAACVLFVFVLSRPVLHRAQDVARRQYCASQLLQMGQGLEAYGGDYEGRLPFAGRSAGSKWWYVGGQDEQHTSNTRHFFLLTKGGYVPTQVFLCPSGRQGGRRVRIRLDASALEGMNDFPGRDYVHYSFRLMVGERNPLWGQQGETPVATDRNPLFASFDVEHNDTLDLSEHAELLEANSPNHGGQGQNVLYLDGRVSFSDQRQLGLQEDDIFTIKSMRQYRGYEVPVERGDDFIAP